MCRLFFLCSVILFSSFSAVAAEIPNCWDNPDVVEGDYLITLHTSVMTKEEILTVLDKADKKYIEAQGYPIVTDDTIVILTQARENRLSKKELKAAAEEELRPIGQVTGVEISCNGIVRQPMEK